MSELSTHSQARTLAGEESFEYSVFGLLLRSNVAFRGFSPISFSDLPPDIRVRLGISPYSEQEISTDEVELVDVSPFATEAGEPVYRIWEAARGGLLHIAYFDGTQFWIDSKRSELWATWPTGSSLEDTLTYLLGPVFGILLRLRGVTCLHASAVSFGDSSVAIVGWAGAGKSTTAAAFARQGCPVLSDDIVALEEKAGNFYVSPAYPHLCLWPDSVNALYGSPDALPRFVPDWEKRRLALGEEQRFESRTLPLHAIYILGERRPDPAPYVKKVAPQDALMSLVTETYATRILDRALRAREFELLGRLAASIPIRRIHAHEDPARLGQLCEVIREDFAALEHSVSTHPEIIKA